MASLLPVAEARRMIVDDLNPVGTEPIKLWDALGRVLRTDSTARVSHPPADVSAMDGYAVRSDDVTAVPKSLHVVGESAAGHPCRIPVNAGEAVRIFTGAFVPVGADSVVIQEDTTARAESVTLNEAPTRGRHIRRAGQDFKAGDVVLTSPRRLTARDIGLLSAMNHPRVTVSKRPVIGVISTGDEIVMPGEPIGVGQIVSANGPALCAFIAAHGGEAFNLGIVKDDPKALVRIAEKVRHLDMLVTSGGVSVGYHDVVKGGLTSAGFKAAFHKIAMRPGKPLLYGRLHDLPVMGLPGNPVSAMVCAVLFLGAALAKLQGLAGDPPQRVSARLATDLNANDSRTDHIRATIGLGPDGIPVVTPFAKQDSAMLANFARADVLIVREPGAPAAQKGQMVFVIPLS